MQGCRVWGLWRYGFDKQRRVLRNELELQLLVTPIKVRQARLQENCLAFLGHGIGFGAYSSIHIMRNPKVLCGQLFKLLYYASPNG